MILIKSHLLLKLVLKLIKIVFKMQKIDITLCLSLIYNKKTYDVTDCIPDIQFWCSLSKNDKVPLIIVRHCEDFAMRLNVLISNRDIPELYSHSIILSVSVITMHCLRM
jgi:hypothetical protein